MKVVRLPQALVDLVEIAQHITQDDIEVADRFFDAFEETIAARCLEPDNGPSCYQPPVVWSAVTEPAIS